MHSGLQGEAEGQGHAGEAWEPSRQVKEEDAPARWWRAKASPLARHFCLHHPRHALKMFVGTVIEELCLVVLSLVPNL